LFTIYCLKKLYQEAFDWKHIKQVAKVKPYHRILRGTSGLDILTALAKVVTHGVTKFASQYREGWYTFQGIEDHTLQFGFESEIGRDKTATREGDFEKIEDLLSKELPFLRALSTDVRQALILAEVSRRKVSLLSKFDWGAIVVSFTKPVERYCKDVLQLRDKQTLGDVVGTLEYGKSKDAWRPVIEQLRELNDLYVRGKHLQPPPIRRADLETARDLSINILKHAQIVHSRSERSS
jgi:hypothetical protein